MGHYDSCYEYDEKREEFRNYVRAYYDIYDQKNALENKLAELNPHIQNMLDKGFSYVIDEVILERQRKNV